MCAIELFIQRQHNVELALKELRKNLFLPAGISSHSIADGHREKTLALLWTIIFHFKVSGVCGIITCAVVKHQ